MTAQPTTQEIDDKPFMKDGGEYCNHCPGRTNDHADYCKVPEFVEAARRDAEQQEADKQ